MAVEPPFHRGLLHKYTCSLFTQCSACFRFHCSCFHQGWKSTVSAIVKEHWWKAGFSERCLSGNHRYM